jgi:protein ImuB
LSTDRLQRRWKRIEEPPPDAPPLVVAVKQKSALIVCALDRKATAMGLKVGQPLANARAMLPSLKVAPANAPADLKLLGRIADWCERFTPFVALDPPRGLLLDVTGAAHLFGGEAAMLRRIREDLKAQGFAVRGAMAGTALAALALARMRDGTVAPPGGDAQAIAELPIDALNLDPITTHAFRRAGLKRIGQAAGRDRRELAARFGARLVYTIDTALARAEPPISPRRPLPDYRAERSFAEPIATEDTIRATLHQLASALGAALEKQGEGARRLEAAFFRADGTVRRIAVETGQPVRDPSVVERLFREKLDALIDPLDPGFGFDLIRLAADRSERAEAVAAGFDSDAHAAREIRFLVDRLAARFGAQRVQAFVPNDTHIPEAAWAAVPAQYAPDAPSTWEKIRGLGEAPRRPLRLFARPEPLSLLQSVPGSRTLHMRWRSAQRTLTRAEGPERIAMEWWRRQEVPPTRDYYRAEDDQGRRLWLYRDAETAQWLMHGVFA